MTWRIKLSQPLRFAAFGAGETTSLRIYRRDSNINEDRRDVDEQEDAQDDETNASTVSVILCLKDLIFIFKYIGKIS